MQIPVFERNLIVQPEHLDALNHVNNVVYVQWVQDISTLHWTSAALPEHQQAYAWVLIRHEIDYKGAARLGDELILRTWMQGVQGLKVERRTEVVRAADQKILAKSCAFWCMLDLKTQHPTRISDAVAAPFLP